MDPLKYINKSNIKDEFVKLIKIRSQSNYEREISNYLQKQLSHYGLHVIEDDNYENKKHGSGNLICHLEGDPTITPIMFTAHMDTIDLDGTVNPYIQDNYIYSDGMTILGADNKVGIAVLLETIKILKENDIPHGHIDFIFTVNEELGMLGAKALDHNLLKAKYGYALDHTGKIGHLVTKSYYNKKVFITIKTDINRKNDHSAIKMATKVIKRINIGQVDDDTMIHIVSFGGDNKQNQSYEFVNITIDIKSLIKEKLERQINYIQSVISQLEDEFSIIGDVNTDLICTGYTLQNNDQAILVAEHAAKQLNLSTKYLTTTHCSDANIFISKGIPTINLAVGYENIHTHSERYNLDYLPLLTKFVLNIINETVEQGK